MNEQEIKALVERLTAEGRFARVGPTIRQWEVDSTREEAFARAAQEFPPIDPAQEQKAAEALKPKKPEKKPEKKTEKKATDPPDEPKAPKGKDKEKKDYRQAIEWVAEHMVDAKVTIRSAPGPIAWGILEWARSSQANRTKFYTDLLPKVLPSKQQLDREARFQDDGRVLKIVQGLIQKPEPPPSEQPKANE